MILLWFTLEGIEYGFVAEKYVDENFVCIMEELKDCWVLGEDYGLLF
jgi:hypothetical protein